MSPSWLTYLDLACATLAAGLCYASPRPEPLLLALVPWAIRLLTTRRLTRRTLFDLPLALFLLSAGVGVWVACDRTAAWARFWLILGGVLFFYALANAAPAGRLHLWLLAAIGGVVAIVFVLTNDWTAAAKIGLLARLGQALQAPLPRLPGPGANANIVGAILAMLLPFAGLAALQAWQRANRAPRTAPAFLALALALLLFLLSVFGWIMTASRGAWMAVLGALLVAAAWLASARLAPRTGPATGAGLSTGPATGAGLSTGPATGAGWSTDPAHQQRIFATWLALGLLAVAAVTVARPGVIAALLDALPGPSAVGSRLDLWRNGLLLARDYPFTGLGLDGFMMAYSSYVMLLHVGFTPHAHNLYLDLAVAQGLPGLLIFIGLCALFFRRFWRDRTRLEAPQRSALGAAALSLLIILLHGLVDDTLYSNRAILLLFVPLAFAGAPLLRPAPAAGGGPRPAIRRTSLALPLGLVVLLAAALLWRLPLLSQVASNRGAVYQTRIELSDYAWPAWPIQDELRRQRDLGPAVAWFERALDLDPRNPTANRRLGQIELSLGRYAAALGHLRAAYAAEPWSTTTRQLLGEACLANGQQEAGRALWASVSNDQRQLDIRVWWYEHIGDGERAAWMRWAAGGQP